MKKTRAQILRESKKQDSKELESFLFRAKIQDFIGVLTNSLLSTNGN